MSILSSTHTGPYFKVEQLPTDFVIGKTDYENYVLVHSSEYTKLYGEDKNHPTSQEYEFLDGLVKISAGKKTIYRKCRGAAMPVQIVAIGYRSLKYLKGTDMGNLQNVTITKTCWLCFMWHHPDTAVRYSFWATFVFGVISIILGVASIILGVCNSCGCCML